MRTSRIAGVLAGLLLVTTAVTTVNANAATDPDDPALHWAGSQVAKHEGGGGAGFAPLAGLPGLDVSSYQGNVDWSSVAAKGAKFAYVKATEGTTYTDPTFAHQYNGSYNAGLIRGAYHFARPNNSSGVAQADYFVAHGGGWSKDGKTLPPMLDIEYAPSGDQCYGLSQASMRSWIQAFSNEVHAKTTRWATVYTTTDWWTKCTGNWSGLSQTNPLFIARYSSSPGTLPAGWGTWTFWQFADSGTFPGDQDQFNGSAARLLALANNTA
ncbi:lysozyme [Kutzneria sp. CA-103260]|uniref:lysozyme n=1 Tax=Kutzneria sp. CA-103260 TaxID=2802641 RepID=UPI001BA7257B|nr:lysozyme [Kutzneria sp. CA-103260]QUQ67354.1 lysozyme [Kutzneria sp. CA-103260]